MTMKLSAYLTSLYNADETPHVYERVKNIITEYQGRIKKRDETITEHDSILITYGDQVQAPSEKPLQTLNTFCSRYLKNIVNGIHILPFYPWTSDDGFSVVDYRKVDPHLGNWEDIS